MKSKNLVLMIAVFAMLALVLVGCPTESTGSTTKSYYSITFPESYAQDNFWGATAGQYAVKFVFIKNSVLSTLEATSDSTEIFTDANECYVFGDASLGNGIVTVADLGATPVTPSCSVANGYSGVSVTKSGTNLTVMIDPTLIGDYLQLKTSSETNTQAASSVASGYTPCLIGGITSTDDASGDANCVGHFWNTYALKMSNK